VKAWYLRGVAHLKMKNFDDATTDLKMAIKLNPTDKKLRSEFDVLKAEKKKHSSSQSSAM
jgi:Flp pilus assembly protein TadD